MNSQERSARMDELLKQAGIDLPPSIGPMGF
ncbi:Uncharacterised protein [Burkholderia pseudomallei]|nr:Uncharacterised protein [Burkholderia pseudomallei]